MTTLDRLIEEEHRRLEVVAETEGWKWGSYNDESPELRQRKQQTEELIRRTAAAIREEDAKIAMTTPFHRVCEQHIGEIGLLFQGCKEIAEAIKNQTL